MYYKLGLLYFDAAHHIHVNNQFIGHMVFCLFFQRFLVPLKYDLYL